MKKDSRLIKQNLGTLLKRFSKNDVIVTLEKEYNAANTKTIAVALIDDNAFLKTVRVGGLDLVPLSESIKQNGIVSPLIVRPKKDHFEIVLGRKRLYIAKQIGLAGIPVVVREMSDEEMLIMMLASLRDNRDINAVSMAVLARALTKDYGYTQQSIADLVHQSRSQITNMLRLLNLPADILEDVTEGILTYGHAKALATLPESLVDAYAKKIIEGQLSVREAEHMVASYKQQGGFVLKEKQWAAKWHADVRITGRSVKLTFSSENELAVFLEKLDQ